MKTRLQKIGILIAIVLLFTHFGYAQLNGFELTPSGNTENYMKYIRKAVSVNGTSYYTGYLTLAPYRNVSTGAYYNDITPFQKLQIQGGNILLCSGNGPGAITDINPTSRNGAILFSDWASDNATNKHGKWGIEYESQSSTGGLNFFKPVSQLTTTRVDFNLFLRNDGNVGIGLGDPSQKLDIDGNIRLRNNATIGTWSNNPLTFNTNSVARMVILADGKVGVGTITPSEKLDIDGNIRLRNNASIGTWSKNSLTFNTNSAARMIILDDGKVGVGTTPATLFHVAGDVTISTLANPGMNKIVASDASGKLALISTESLGDNLGNHNATQSLNMSSYCIRNNAKGDKNVRADGSEYCVGLKFDDDNNMVLETGKPASFSVVAAGNSNSELWVTNWTSGGYGLKLNADNKTGGIYRDNNNPSLVLGFNSTKVGVNVIPPADGQYSFYVKGGILAEEVRVMLQSNWPDYVFNSNYQLPSLQHVERFIQNNGHLPGIPDAQTVEKEGINLGEMNGLLLKKIEELTLYMIELEKRIEGLKSFDQE